MQRNPGYPSIEGELEKAICKAGGISAANADSFSKVWPLTYVQQCIVQLYFIQCQTLGPCSMAAHISMAA